MNKRIYIIYGYDDPENAPIISTAWTLVEARAEMVGTDYVLYQYDIDDKTDDLINERHISSYQPQKKRKKAWPTHQTDAG